MQAKKQCSIALNEASEERKGDRRAQQRVIREAGEAKGEADRQQEKWSVLYLGSKRCLFFTKSVFSLIKGRIAARGPGVN